MAFYIIIYILLGYILMADIRQGVHTSFGRWIVLIALWPAILITVVVLYVGLKLSKKDT